MGDEGGKARPGQSGGGVVSRRSALSWVAGMAGVAALAAAGRATWHLVDRLRHERALQGVTGGPGASPDEGPASLDDESGLESTGLARRVEAAAAEVPGELRAAASAGLAVCVGGSRHSMGAQTLVDGGLHIDRSRRSSAALVPQRDGYTVDAGLTWRQVLSQLAPAGRSVAVMQANNDFTVGGSISVNAHGWQTRRGPVCGTVRSITLASADGEIVRCSRTEEPELFSLACGGFGLFGVILDAELESVADEAYRVRSRTLRADGYHEAWRELVGSNAAAALSYGRLRVSRKSFLREAVLNVFEATDDASDDPASGPAAERLRDDLVRAVFRGSEGSEYGKRLRWDLELLTGGESAGPATRNAIMDRSATGFGNLDPTRVDLLHESFVPRHEIGGFIDDLRRIIPRHDVDLLNITVRDISADSTAVLNYARQDVFALVFLFNLPRDPASDRALGACVREVIDATLDRGGSYYLPYRPYATRRQLERAYPALERFVQARDRYDPGRRFRSRFADRYGLG